MTPFDPAFAADDAEEIALVVVPGASLRWGLPTEHVLGAYAEHEWWGSAPIEWESLVGAPATAERSAARILLLKTRGEPQAVRVRGEISLVTVPRSQLLELPKHLLGGEVEGALGILFSDTGDPLLVMNVNRIGEAPC